MKQPNSRRQFLKNLGLGTAALSFTPLVGKARSLAPEVCDATTLDYYGEGPFYTANPPEMVDGKLAGDTELGTRLVLTGRVFDLDCQTPLANTRIDVWHANDAGAYDDSGYNLRGFTTSNAQGYYQFETVYPGKYLNGGSYRPSHIHFKITPPGQSTLVTQLYFEGDSDIPKDAAASINSGTYDASDRIIPTTENGEGKLEGVWDINIKGGRISIEESLHLERGMIYSVSPNPAVAEVNINYGVFKPGIVSIEVFDLQGRMVAQLEKQHLSPEKYSAVWNPDPALPRGAYFISLKLNDAQVHYLKLLRM